jgi:hypothetical protein
LQRDASASGIEGEAIMVSVLVGLMPIILASALLPVWIMAVLLLLNGSGGTVRGATFVGVIVAARLVQGLIVSILLNNAVENGGDEGGIVLPLVITLLGILFLITGIKKLINEPDLDEPKGGVLTKISTLSMRNTILLALVGSLLAVKQWVFMFAAVGTIQVASLSGAEATITFVLYVLLSASLLIAPVLICVLLPAKSVALLGRMQAFLDKYNRPITVGVSLIFGVLFLLNGVSGLLGN